MSQILKERDELKYTESNKSKRKGKKKKSVIKKIIIVLLILMILGGGTLAFLLYGPYSGFREWYITSAMTTMTHQWLAYLFYDDDTINEVLGKNRVDEIEEDTDLNTIVISSEEKKETKYENEYEKQILEKDEGNNDYKIIEISGKRI